MLLTPSIPTKVYERKAHPGIGVVAAGGSLSRCGVEMDSVMTHWVPESVHQLEGFSQLSLFSGTGPFSIFLPSAGH